MDLKYVCTILTSLYLNVMLMSPSSPLYIRNTYCTCSFTTHFWHFFHKKPQYVCMICAAILNRFVSLKCHFLQRIGPTWSWIDVTANVMFPQIKQHTTSSCFLLLTPHLTPNITNTAVINIMQSVQEGMMSARVCHMEKPHANFLQSFEFQQVDIYLVIIMYDV